MSHIEKLKAEMLSISQKNKLPTFYADDLEKDLSMLEKYNGRELIWVLRTCGSLLVPIKVGVHPTYVMHWTTRSSGQEIVMFLVDTRLGIIEKINFDEANRMIQQPPCQLNTSMSKEKLSDLVDHVLSVGCSLKVWGVFESPTYGISKNNWAEWQRYFKAAGNYIMDDFISKAIRFNQR
ncbi:hypothetical protein NMD70_18270 (plasmid) [Edwardsiella tarda]|uniref:hypothetical protein n=1 Tax=Edwardsiella tarda TaxID=636 RepID=UPI003A6EDC1A